MEVNLQNDILPEIIIVRPWRRFFARFIDQLVFSFILGAAAEFLGAGYLFGNPFISIIVTTVIWLFIESILIADFSTTPGKAILGISVVYLDGSRLSFLTAIKRTALVFVIGQALMVPILNLFAYIGGYFFLRQNKTTHWDSMLSTKVVHKPTRIVQWLLAFAILFGMVLLTTYINIWSKN